MGSTSDDGVREKGKGKARVLHQSVDKKTVEESRREKREQIRYQEGQREKMRRKKKEEKQKNPKYSTNIS